MKGSWKRFSGLVLAGAITFGMIVPGSHAGPSVATVRFKLPFEASIGKRVLPAGDYVISVEHAGLGAMDVSTRTENLGKVFPQEFSERKANQSQNTGLICIRHDGKVTVRALQLPDIGTYYFPLPKDANELVSQQPQLLEVITVQANGQ